MGKGKNVTEKKAKGGGPSSNPSVAPPEKAIAKPNNPASKGKKKRSEIDDIFGLASEAAVEATNAGEPLSGELKEIADQIKKARDTKKAAVSSLPVGSRCMAWVHGIPCICCHAFAKTIHY